MSPSLYYKKLNLPTKLLADEEQLKLSPWNNIGYKINTNPDTVLSSEVVNSFASIGVTPGYLVFFNNSEPSVADKRYLHKDLIAKPDPRQLTTLANVSWDVANFGINFELYDNENLFYWYAEDSLQVGNVPSPNYDAPLFRAWLSGIHYTNKNNVKEVDSVSIRSTPLLVRTDVPHKTLFNISPTATHRVGMSIRFYENWKWQEALEIFAPLISE